jgi:GTP-binding protein
LFIDLGANDQQIDFPFLYAIGRDGVAGTSIDEMADDLRPLFAKILQCIPAPKGDPEGRFQMLVSDLGYSDYLGRLAIGKVVSGQVKTNDHLVCLGEDGNPRPLRVTRLQTFEGMNLQPAENIMAGDICVLSGIEDIHIGDTICHQEAPKALPRIRVDEPTVGMRFTINTSPLAGREGSLVQSGKIRERLFKETLKNVSLQVEELENKETFLVKGRGEFQMAILIETMRREGFELTVGRPEVLYKEEGGNLLEPMEEVIIDCDQEYTGVITEKLAGRKGKMVSMNTRGNNRVRMEFSLPSRGLIGYRDEFLTDTRGTGLLNTYFAGYESFRGKFASRSTGSIVADRSGQAVAYALFNLEPRGEIFIVPNDAVYEGMIFGEHNRPTDLNANPCKEKKLTNVRAAGRDENVILTPVRPMTLERAIHFIREDEMVEVTPKNIRLRKTILSAQKRQAIR